MKLRKINYLFLVVAYLFANPVLANNFSNSLQSLTSDKKLNTPIFTKRFYELSEIKTWNEKQLNELIESINKSYEQGLSPQDYHIKQLTNDKLDKDHKNILATDAYLTLSSHIIGGKVNPVSVEPTWSAKGREKDLVAYLQNALNKNNVKQSITELAPSQPNYHLLLKSLAKYREINSRGGWEVIPNGETLKVTMQSARVEALRKRLEATDDIKPISSGRDIYDESLLTAVKKFQLRANMEPDGVVGPNTLYKLNRTAEDRINQLKVNLERWRWLPENMENKHIRVNIADYKLEAYEGNDVVAVHDVVVGRIYRQTPIFSSNMTYLVLNPSWNVPSSLARKDILPKFKKNPSIINTLGYQLIDKTGKPLPHQNINWNNYSESNFPFIIRQKPGVQNALGQVKLMFPNEFSVYLHDTPSRDLFSKTRRDFSSGCIRVKNPIDLTQWILNDNESWSRNKINSVLESEKETTVLLKKQVPVHILYWTVVTDDKSDNVRFIEDIYERDNKILTALNKSFGK